MDGLDNKLPSGSVKGGYCVEISDQVRIPVLPVQILVLIIYRTVQWLRKICAAQRSSLTKSPSGAFIEGVPGSRQDDSFVVQITLFFKHVISQDLEEFKYTVKTQAVAELMIGEK